MYGICTYCEKDIDLVENHISIVHLCSFSFPYHENCWNIYSGNILEDSWNLDICAFCKKNNSYYTDVIILDKFNNCISFHEECYMIMAPHTMIKNFPIVY